MSKGLLKTQEEEEVTKARTVKRKDEKACCKILEFPTEKLIIINWDRRKREWYRRKRIVSTAKDLGAQFTIIFNSTSHKRGNSVFEIKNMTADSEITCFPIETHTEK